VHGTGYVEVVDSVRHEMAMDLVEQGRLSFTEIAFLLGFTAQSGSAITFRTMSSFGTKTG
jgi:transcriptional regulator GlxA family with amidase domain